MQKIIDVFGNLKKDNALPAATFCSSLGTTRKEADTDFSVRCGPTLAYRRLLFELCCDEVTQSCEQNNKL